MINSILCYFVIGLVLALTHIIDDRAKRCNGDDSFWLYGSCGKMDKSELPSLIAMIIVVFCIFWPLTLVWFVLKKVAE